VTVDYEFQGRFFDGKTAQPQDVGIAVSDTGLTIRSNDGTELAVWPADKIVLTERPRAGEPVFIGREGTTSRLIVKDAKVTSAINTIAPRAGRRTRIARRTLIRTGFWVSAAAGAAAIIFLVLIPLLSEQLAARTPESWKRSIGDAALNEVIDILPRLPSETGQVNYCLGPEGLQVLQNLAQRLISNFQTKSEIRTHIISANLVNAFALPGGIVVLTDGLLKSAESPEEIAGVLAHEIGHVIYAHPTQVIFRTTAVSLLISALIGDFTGGVLIAGVTEWALNSAYSRGAEREADEFAIHLLNAVGIDGKGLARFFERLLTEYKEDTENPVLRLISSHPPTKERMDFIRARTTASGKAMTVEEWKDLKWACLITGDKPKR